MSSPIFDFIGQNPSVFELKHLRLIVAIAEEKNLSKAGDTLSMSPSAVWHQLRALESALGTKMFERIGKALRLTKAGEALFESAAQILPLVAGTEQLIRRGTFAKTISVGVHSVGTHWLPGAARKFREEFPEIEISVITAPSRELSAGVIAGTIDIIATVDRPESRNVKVIDLYEDELKLYVGSEHRLAKRPYVRPSDLVHEHILGIVPLTDTVLYSHFLRRTGVIPKRFSQIARADLFGEMVRQCYGVCGAPKSATAIFDTRGVAEKRLGAKGVFLTVSLAHSINARPHVLRLVEMFIAEMKRCGKLPDR